MAKATTETTAATARSASSRWDALVQEDRVHRALYTDPEIFREEMLKIFAGIWVFLGHESELPEAHDFKAGTLGTRPLLLTRDANGELHAFFNRCTHRGARVCREERGSARHFRCGYHGWTFDSSGRLVGVPFPDAYGPQFDPGALGLGEVPRLESYRGLIFGTLNTGAPDLLEHLGAAKPLLDRWFEQSPVGRVNVRSGAHRIVYRGNWKLAYDNAADGYHPPFSHRSLQEMTDLRYGDGKSLAHFMRDPDQGPMYQQALGNGHTFCDQRPAMGPSFWRQDRPVPGGDACEATLRERLGEVESERMLEYAVGWGMNLNIFPNLLVIGNQLQVIEPIAVDRTQLTWYATTTEGVPDEINTLRMRMQEDFPSFGEPDDLANFEECQRGLAIPELEWIQIGRGLGGDRQKTGPDGVTTAPITDELQLRSYLQAWKRYMSADVALGVGRVGGVHCLVDPVCQRRSDGLSAMAPEPAGKARDSADPSQDSYYIDDAYYADLLAEVAAWTEPGAPAERPVREACETLLSREARSLDEGRYEEWLALFSSECLYWIPAIPGGGDPRREVSLVFDDRRRLEDRIARLRTGNAYSQIPPSRTRHLLTNLEVWTGGEGGAIRARVNFAVYEYRLGVQRALVGWCGYHVRREAEDWRIVRKMVSLIDSDQGLENLSLIL